MDTMTPMDTPTPDSIATWGAFADGAPRFAERVRERFAANLHHIIGTVRTDGSPRLSGTEVDIGAAAITIGMMPGSRKLEDVRRDPRVEVHSAPLEDDLAGGDAKLTGRLVERAQPPAGHPDASSFELLLERVSLVRVADDQLILTTWDPVRGQREQRRR